MIFAGGPPAVRAAKAQTATIPIVFFIGEDPVKEGLVTSLNRPGGNVTGVSFLNQLFGKQLGVLRDIVPTATRFVFSSTRTIPMPSPMQRTCRPPPTRCDWSCGYFQQEP